MNYGGNINSLVVPGRSRAVEVIVGHSTLDQYLVPGSCRSAITGRFANRIAGGRFTLDGRVVVLERNEPPNTIHGGRIGFDRILWESESDRGGVVLRHRSPDGHEGFPGTLKTEVRYEVTADSLNIDYTATTNSVTVVNLTNHAFFNLAESDDILDHVLTLRADRFLAVDEHAIPTGELRSVVGTPLDFRTPRRVGDRIDASDEQLKLRGGYDHTFVLADAPVAAPAQAAILQGGHLTMEVLTTEPGVQFYSGNSMRAPHRPRAALCLETQHFPDSPNQSTFPATVLRPGQTFRSTTVYRFASSP